MRRAERLYSAMIRCEQESIIFDIDGTLLSEITRQVPESTKEALRIARSLGHLVFVNTGRSYGSLGPIKGMLEVDGWLCGCGTYVEAQGRELYHRQCLRSRSKRSAEPWRQLMWTEFWKDGTAVIWAARRVVFPKDADFASL